MRSETLAQRRERVARINQGLAQAYPNAHCELNYSTPLELLVATILSAQSNDKQVNVVTQDLFKKYRTPHDYAAADLHAFQEDVRRIGLFRNKARSIQGCCRALIDQHRSQVPRTLEELVQLPGVGRKTANVILGNAFGINAGVVVDTHVARLSWRLKLTRDSKPEKIERDLMKLLPVDEWCQFSHRLIWHGRRRCTARSPDCPGCEVRGLCPSAGRV